MTSLQSVDEGVEKLPENKFDAKRLAAAGGVDCRNGCE
jgi:hypothetical protein